MARDVKIGVEIESSWRGKGVDAAKKEIGVLDQGFKKLNALAVGAVAGAGAAVTAFVADSIRTFGNFEQGMAEVFTLLPGITGDAMGKMKRDVRDFSLEVGRLPEEVVPALYQAISAGVPQENVFDFMRVASDAALGGVTNLETAVDGITSVVNAYGAEVVDAQRASDLMFTAVKLGKTNFDELSRSLFQVIPTAAALDLEFSNVTAALAAMTAQGVPTSVATTQLRQVLVELSKEGSKAAGIFQDVAGVGFRDFIAQGGNLQQALALLERAAASSNVGINDLFGSVEAGSAALMLTGAGTETFIRNLNEMQQAAGATGDAAAIMADTAAQAAAEFQAAVNELKLMLGEELAPMAAQFTANLTEGIRTALAISRNDYEGDMERIVAANLELNNSLEDVQDTAAAMAASLVTANDLTGMSWRAMVPILGDLEIAQRRVAKQSRDALAAGLKEATMQAIELTNGAKGLDEVLGSLFGSDARWVGDEIWIDNTFIATQEELNRYIDVIQAASFDQAIMNQRMAEATQPAAVAAANYNILAQAYSDMTSEAREYYDSYAWVETSLEFAAIAAEEAAERTEQSRDALEEWNRTVDRISRSGTDSVVTLFDRLAEQEKRLEDSSGVWVKMWRENKNEFSEAADEIAEINRLLANDLSDRQKRAFERILLTTEEGSSEWLSAWNALQGDLTESQRNNLIAQRGNLETWLSDVELVHGEFVNVYTGDAQAAREAQEEIDRLNQAIAQSYREMVLEVILANFGGVFTEEVGRAAVSLGLMTESQAENRVQAERYKLQIDNLIDLFSDEFVDSDGTVRRAITSVDDFTEAYLLLESGMVDTAELAWEVASGFTILGQDAETAAEDGLKPMIEMLERMPDSVLIEMGLLNADGTLTALGRIDQEIGKIERDVRIQFSVDNPFGGLSTTTVSGASLPAIPQAHGGDWMVNRPTLFLAGEAGPERATFTPLWKMGSDEGDNGRQVVVQGPLMQIENMNASNQSDVDELLYRLQDMLERKLS